MRKKDFGALEFPNGQVLKLTQLVAGQTATVLQLPVATEHAEHVETRHVTHPFDSRVTLNRAGTASILVPNQGAVMLWRSCRSAAISLSAGLVQSLQRVKARKRHPIPADVDAEIEPSFNTDVLAVTLLQKPAAQKPQKKTQVQAAACVEVMGVRRKRAAAPINSVVLCSMWWLDR